MRKRLLLPLSLVFVTGCSKPDEWAAFVYTDIDNMPGPEHSERYIIGKFETFEACQAGAIDRMRVDQSQTGKQGAYVCDHLGNPLVCREKRK
jgi:hypothetical protein